MAEASESKRARNLILVDLHFKEDRGYFIEDLSMLLASGMPIFSALAAIRAELRSRRMRDAVDSIIADVDVGSSLWSAIERTEVFPKRVVSLIRVGEEAGRLSENLRVVVTQQRRESDLHAKVQSATLYPILVLSLAVIIGTGISWFLLPRLATVFYAMNIELPLLTRILIGFGNFLGNYGYVVVPLFLLLVAGFIYVLFVYPKTKFIGDRIIFALPGFRRLIQEIELARFGYILGSLLDTGLPVVEALESLWGSATVSFYKDFYGHLRGSVEEGNSLKKTFDSYKGVQKLIPTSVRQMVVAAEQSGRLPSVLLEIGKIYDDKTENTTKDLAIMLEPILLVVVWIGVVLVALSVILPIYTLVGQFN